MTLMSEARSGISDVIIEVAKVEGIEPEKLRKKVVEGRITIPLNPIHSPEPLGIGEGLRVKVNANIGTSPDHKDIDEEIQKAKVALKYGSEAVMDLSVGGDLDEIRRKLIKAVNKPFGTVPIYQAGIVAARKSAVVDMSEDDMFSSFERHAKDGVDFVVAHCGITLESVSRLKKQKRILDLVSRGGSFHTAWILHNQKENPLYENYDYLLEIAQKYDLTLSLGDGMRSGCIYDANDRAKIQELLIIGELVERAREKGVSTIVEGPGHVPLNIIESNIKIMKSATKNAPYYVLGPLVTDIAPGYDHIVSAIGGAIAGYAGADFLCYVTPSEHLSLPTVEDVKEGVIAARIAAHSADLARGIGWDRDIQMAKARRDLNWEEMFKLVLDPEKAKKYREKRKPKDEELCSMCGDLCAIKLPRKYLRNEGE
ncbi:MAG: phosphomethylpyrimidine synthase [Methanomassiliicoccales archaeon]|nr:MAG: phosphomethylpyrimidine synthase [Methanomassiliicoccales archaeon]